MLRLELGAQGARIAARRGCRARLERIVISGSDQKGRCELLRRQGSNQAASERFFRRLRCTGGIAARQLIDTAIRNRSQEMAQVEAVSNKIIGQKSAIRRAGWADWRRASGRSARPDPGQRATPS